MKDDAISRQGVLKLLSTIPPEEAMTKAMLIQSVKQMDAAQPEIIRCRECQYWEREKPFATSGRCFIWECANRKGSDYCSEARKVSE